MGEGKDFEQQGFDVNDEGELVNKSEEASDAKDEKELPYLYFQKGARSRTLDYDGKSWVFLQDDIIVIPKGEVQKDGFALFQFICNANPKKREDEYARKQVELSKDRYRRYINTDSNFFLKLVAEDGSKRKAKEYLEEHGKWCIDEL